MDEQWAEVVRTLEPEGRVVRTWTLPGGLSARMTSVEVLRPDGTQRTLVVRRPGTPARPAHPHAAAHEFRILQVVQAAGVAAPAPLALNETGAVLGEPFLVLAYVEGEPMFEPAQGIRCAEAMAEQLARIHAVDGRRADLAFLPSGAERAARLLAPRGELDEALAEGRIRAALAEAGALPAATPPVLLHGDFWPGNLLWRDGQLVAVVDWEDAAVGPRLLDVAISRLDLLWIFGAEAMAVFTQRYQALAGCALAGLAQWDLLAALRPAGRLAEWAAGWPDLGRSDMTEASIQAGHHRFVAQALAALDVG